MKKEITFTAKQVGERVKERRTELNLTMPELGKRMNGSQVFQKIRNMTAERFAKKTWKNISKSTLILCLRL